VWKVGENLTMPPEGKKGDRKTGHGSQVRKQCYTVVARFIFNKLALKANQCSIKRRGLS
jgi:hypothetical protein